MTSDQVEIVLITAAWSGGVGFVGLLLAWTQRHRSLRVLTAGVAVVAVAAVLAGMLGTARAMFLSTHDFEVSLLVSRGGRVGRDRVRGRRRGGVLRAGLAPCATRPGGSATAASSCRPGPARPSCRSSRQELARTSLRLRESREREERLEGSRRELVSWVSHDLRTPLAGLRAMTEALEDGLAEDPARYHHQMRSEVDRMVRMVDDLFELSRIHAGVLKLSRAAGGPG